MRSLVVVFMAAAACSHAAPYRIEEPAAPDRATARAQEQRAEQLEQTLSDLSAAASPPESARVCELVAQICDLSLQICAISGRHRGDPELAGRCEAGEQRCRRARERVPSGCSRTGSY